MTDDWRAAPHPSLDAHVAHVWRVPLREGDEVRAYWPILSAEEQARADRFHREIHRRRFVVAHGALRVLLGRYLGADPSSLEFEAGPHGKPALRRRDDSGERLEFNLSHSGDLALIAVTRGQAVGVDLERWADDVEHLELAERFFSPLERDALRSLAHSLDLVTAGFFAAWTRKESYLKATGHGITRGLHHFDVTLVPGERARLLGDRLDGAATERWSMTELAPAPGYSAALVVASPLHDVLRFTT